MGECNMQMQRVSKNIMQCKVENDMKMEKQNDMPWYGGGLKTKIKTSLSQLATSLESKGCTTLHKSL